MSDTVVNNRRIAKNTLFLYGRMLFSMLISLYTARVVLETLGVSDFGLYNVVGGVIAIFSILKSLISSGTQRFLTFEMGKGSGIETLKSVFSTSLSIFFIIAGIIFLLGETVGLWFLNNYLVIPAGRVFAANVVYQVSIISMLVSVIQLPYAAAIMSHERMDIYGYAGMVEPLLRLGLILILPFVMFDKLITYSIIVLFISVIMTTVYVVVCNRLFEECKLRFKIDKPLFKEMIGFTSFNLLESLSNMMNSQGQDILLNIFFGTTVNAAKATAIQVNNAVHGFANNFLVAIFPQITKTYASGARQDFYNLIIRGAKFAYIVLAVMIIPIFLNTDYLLQLWLKNPPLDSDLFCRLILIATIVRMLSEPLYTGIQATGKIKSYQIWTSSLMLLNIPICFILFKMGMPAFVAFFVSIFMSAILVGARLFFVHKETNFPIYRYIKTILIDCIGVTVLAYIPLYFFNQYMINGLLSFCIISGISVIWSIILFFLLSMTKNERLFIVNLIYKRVKG